MIGRRGAPVRGHGTRARIGYRFSAHGLRLRTIVAGMALAVAMAAILAAQVALNLVQFNHGPGGGDEDPSHLLPIALVMLVVCLGLIAYRRLSGGAGASVWSHHRSGTSLPRPLRGLGEVSRLQVWAPASATSQWALEVFSVNGPAVRVEARSQAAVLGWVHELRRAFPEASIAT